MSPQTAHTAHTTHTAQTEHTALATVRDTPMYRLTAPLVYDALDHHHLYRLAVDDAPHSMHALLPAIPHLTRLRELDLSKLSAYEARGEQVL